MRDIFNVNTAFISKNGFKNFDEFLVDISKFANIDKDSQIEIFTQDSYLFLVAFFGALLSKSTPYLLPHNLPSNSRKFFNDENITNIINSSNKSNNIDIKLDLNSVFYIQTSGSSGERKNIKKTINQMVIEGEFLHKYFNLNSSHIVLSSVSHQHLFGLTFKIFTSLISGSKIHVETLNYPELLKEKLSNYNQNSNILLISSPAILESISKQNSIDEFDKIQMIFSAGSKLHLDIQNNLTNRLKTKIVEIYGSSETGVIAYNLDGDFTIFPGVNTKTDNESRLIISSPWQNCVGGFLSNDCVQINGNSLKIIGRYDRIIKLHDRRISLDGIENLIKQSPFINNVAISQDESHKRLAAILVLSYEGKKLYKTKGKNGIVDQIKLLIKDEYGNKLRYFYIRSSLPINQQGKISKNDFLNSINSKIEPEFKLIQKEPNIIKLTAYIDEGSFYFNGHFLNFPLVPGFIQLGFVFNSAIKYLGLKYENLSDIETIKFINFLRPCDIATLNIQILDNKLYFTLYANDKECANGRLKIAQ